MIIIHVLTALTLTFVSFVLRLMLPCSLIHFLQVKLLPMRLFFPLMLLTSRLPPSLPSIIQPPSLELKELPGNLKYAYLEHNEKLPVIISSNLDLNQEDRLLQVLKRHKKAIGWH